MYPKLSFFLNFFDNVILMKIIDFTIEKQWFSRFGAFKNRSKIDAKTRSKKTSEKAFQKLIFSSILGSQNLPKSLQKPQKSLFKAMLNEACFATLWKSPGSRRKSTGGIAFGPPIWLRIWLGLLHPSIQAFISCWDDWDDSSQRRLISSQGPLPLGWDSSQWMEVACPIGMRLWMDQLG